MVLKLQQYLSLRASEPTEATQAQQEPHRPDKHVRFLTSDGGVVDGGLYGPEPPPQPPHPIRKRKFNYLVPAGLLLSPVPKKSRQRESNSVAAGPAAPKNSWGGMNTATWKNSWAGKNTATWRNNWAGKNTATWKNTAVAKNSPAPKRPALKKGPALQDSSGERNSLDGKNGLGGRNWNWAGALTAIGVLVAGWWMWSSRSISKKVKR